MPVEKAVPQFIHQLTWDDIPVDVRHRAKLCLLDSIGTAAGGRQTPLSDIIYTFAAAQFGGAPARLWFDGRPLSAPGAALAHGMTIDALDIHDSCRPVKGHAGVALVPALLVAAAERPVSGKELLTALVVGYEIATRAGIALHATACDYHTSGAWNALGCAAVISRVQQLTVAQTWHALGIAEYHGPRSQMMRVIDHPTMLKDGSGWGAMTGVSAALLAAAGFTGAPALTVTEPEVASVWGDLGTTWLTMIQYFKPHAVCYWAQPAINGALQLVRDYQLAPAQIARVEVYAFDEATRLATRRPRTTEEAQYSLPFPLAAALIYGCLGYEELSGPALTNPELLDLADRVALIPDAALNDSFPQDRLSRVVLEMVDGRRYDSGVCRALWDYQSSPPTDEDLRDKFRWLAGSLLPPQRVDALETVLWQLEGLADCGELLGLLCAPL